MTGGDEVSVSGWGVGLVFGEQMECSTGISQGIFLWLRLRSDWGFRCRGLIEESGAGALLGVGVLQWSAVRGYGGLGLAG